MYAPKIILLSSLYLFCVYEFTKYKGKHGSQKFRIFNEKHTDSTETAFLKSMIEKVESFITRLRWKAQFFDKKEHSVNNTNFGFKSNFTPPQHELLSPFESDLYDMIRSINFKPVRNDFQKKLTEDINNITSSENLLIFASKTTNRYEMTPEQYKTILTNNVTKTYRKVDRSAQLNIDKEAKTISKTLQLEKRMERYAERPAFIS